MSFGVLRHHEAPETTKPPKPRSPRNHEAPEPQGSGASITFCGAEGIRTPDPLHAMEVRYQLRYSPATRLAPGNP
jgi:hypothetical protein